MNDLLPPSRRSIPERRRALMREQLDSEIDSATVGRPDGAARRFGIPVLIAAAVAALALGGYVVAGDDDGGSTGGGLPPAGQGNEGPQANQPKPRDDKGAPTAMSDPEPAYRECIDLAVESRKAVDEPVGDPLEGKLAIESELGVTVVVANSSDAYTCNIKPDQAVSHPQRLDGTLDESDFWFALNARSSDTWDEGNTITEDDQGNLVVLDDQGNVVWSEKEDPDRSEFPGSGAYRGDMVWAGGEAPDGVTAIRYTFPDGHTEEAVVQDGFWAIQYYSDKAIPAAKTDRIEVTVEGAGGQTFELPFTIDTMCNQVSHGC